MCQLMMQLVIMCPILPLARKIHCECTYLSYDCIHLVQKRTINDPSLSFKTISLDQMTILHASSIESCNQLTVLCRRRRSLMLCHMEAGSVDDTSSRNIDNGCVDRSLYLGRRTPTADVGTGGFVAQVVSQGPNSVGHADFSTRSTADARTE